MLNGKMKKMAEKSRDSPYILGHFFPRKNGRWPDKAADVGWAIAGLQATSE
jgi:hypothetical protein